MIGQILPNNNERCYNNFSPTFREVNTPLVEARYCPIHRFVLGHSLDTAWPINGIGLV
jgi:hypothetical protein